MSEIRGQGTRAGAEGGQAGGWPSREMAGVWSGGRLGLQGGCATWPGAYVTFTGSTSMMENTSSGSGKSCSICARRAESRVTLVVKYQIW